MPKRYVYRKKPTKKVYKKQTRKPVTRKPVIQRSLVIAGKGFPDKMLMTHKYFQVFEMSGSAGATSTRSFLANGIYDPDTAPGGHQPYGSDQMKALYNHWVVIGSKITISIQHYQNTNTTASFALYLNDDATVVPTYESLMETNKARFLTIPLTNTDNHKLSCKFSAKRTFGKGILANSNLRGSSTADPTENAVFTLAAFPVNISSSQSYTCQAYIEYIVMWFELKDIGGS